MSNVDKEKIEKLQKMLSEANALMAAAAQYAGENNIPLKYIDEGYDDYLADNDAEDQEDDYDGVMYFGGQDFELRQRTWGDKSFYWYNSNC